MSIGGSSVPHRRQVSLLAKLMTPQAWHFVLLIEPVVPQILSIGWVQAGLKAFSTQQHALDEEPAYCY